jgi:hypothetical protein
MSDCRFSITFTGDPTEIVNKTKEGITKAGGKFEGDIKGGSVVMPSPVGDIEGNYTVEGQNLEIEIVKKPVFVPCSLIESELKKRIL